MISPRVNITDTASPRLEELYGRVAPGRRRPLMRRLGKALETVLREHFKERNLASDAESKRARKGFPSSGLWNRIRQQTALSEVTDGTAVVSIGEPAMRTKLYGAHITPGPGKKFLAIPLRAVVYGKSPRGNPVPGLFFKRIRDRAYLAANDNDRLRVYYILLRSVRVPRDPRAMPDEDATARRLVRIAEKEVTRGI